MRQKKSGLQNILSPKKYLGPRKIWVQKNYGSKKNFGPKKVLDENKFWQKKILVKKIDY